MRVVVYLGPDVMFLTLPVHLDSRRRSVDPLWCPARIALLDDQDVLRRFPKDGRRDPTRVDRERTKDRQEPGWGETVRRPVPYPRADVWTRGETVVVGCFPRGEHLRRVDPSCSWIGTPVETLAKRYVLTLERFYHYHLDDIRYALCNAPRLACIDDHS